MQNVIEVMPRGYCLQALDECGVVERQPHVVQKTPQVFNWGEVDEDLPRRTVVRDRQAIEAAYSDLRPGEYALAVTYVCDHGHSRVQSLWAGTVEIHPPYTLHPGRAERLLVKVPGAAIHRGRLDLRFKREGEGEVVLGALELWGSMPSPKELRILQLETLFSDLRGVVTDIRFRPVSGARVQVQGSSGSSASAATGADGRFSFHREDVASLGTSKGLRITAAWNECVAAAELTVEQVAFVPVHYRPTPAAVADLGSACLSLDGEWRAKIVADGGPAADSGPAANSGPAADSGSVAGRGSAAADALLREAPASWGSFSVPGQFAQAGFDVADDQDIAVAREFTVPADWKGSRIFLRFDSVHGGARYWLNEKYLGESENLFTPVEWEISDAARVGAANRLVLLVRLSTLSERLSYSSGYAFHSLTGIDRKVQLFALPRTHIKELRIWTDLDAAYRDASLNLQTTVQADGPADGLALRLVLSGPDGKEVRHSAPETPIRFGADGTSTVTIRASVSDPAKWSAEKPNLYRLTLELRLKGSTLERVERAVGFRAVEVKGSQLYVNGRRVKLAGACHHELHPLTGRADTARWAEKDIQLMKGANLNYLRTSHYPPTEEILEWADRLGMYVECEAPLCWVREKERDVPLREVLTPTSAMIDFCHSHPSIILWSLANESNFKQFFKVANRLCKELDPTRPTTFNDPDPERVCDIANLHYPPMPYDEQLRGDPRPVLLGEYFFPLCHEQTDVRVDPGLRELWGQGHADPESEWGRYCARGVDRSAGLLPGAPPGAWTHIVRSQRVIGGAIWAFLDEPFYLPKGRKAGYAWVHGYWGLADGWRRTKPEWWLSKLIFSPVWFPQRVLPLPTSAATIQIPVENRYSFTNLSELTLAWELGKSKGTVKADVPPSCSGAIEVTLPKGTAAGSSLVLRALTAGGELVSESVLVLGKPANVPLPRPDAGCPSWKEEGSRLVVEENGFGLVFDRATMRCALDDPRHRSAITEFPRVHATRFDFADLVHPRAAPYAELPDVSTRRVEEVALTEKPSGLQITVTDSYDGCRGSITWLIDANGLGRVSSQYELTGPGLAAREVGVRFCLAAECDRLAWRRWSEWGRLPEDHIGRTQGTAIARRDESLGPGGEGVPPAWPWALDQTELGTNDFRGVKLNVYEATLSAEAGRGVRIHANADVHVRACLDPASGGTLLHALSECRLGPVRLERSAAMRSEFIVRLTGS